MPAAAVFVNLAGDNVTAERVIDTQLPELAALHPDVVTIWVESADVRLATPAATYQVELGRLVAGARRAGARKVLVLTPPANEQNLSGGLAASVADVAAQTGATLVKLGDTSDRYTDAGQRRIAELGDRRAQVAGDGRWDRRKRITRPTPATAQTTASTTATWRG